MAVHLGGSPGAATCMVALEVALHLGGSPGAATCMVALEVAAYLSCSPGKAAGLCEGGGASEWLTGRGHMYGCAGGGALQAKINARCTPSAFRGSSSCRLPSARAAPSTLALLQQISCPLRRHTCHACHASRSASGSGPVAPSGRRTHASRLSPQAAADQMPSSPSHSCHTSLSTSDSRPAAPSGRHTHFTRLSAGGSRPAALFTVTHVPHVSLRRR